MFEKFVHEDPLQAGEHCIPFRILATNAPHHYCYSQTNSCIWLTKEAILGWRQVCCNRKYLISSLTFHEHTVSSCSSSLAQINRVKDVFDRSTLTTMINTLVFSKLFYCSSVWSNAADTNLLKLQAVQNFASRIICVSRKFDHVTPLLKELHWPPIRSQLYLRDAVLYAFKCMTGSAPTYTSHRSF